MNVLDAMPLVSFGTMRFLMKSTAYHLKLINVQQGWSYAGYPSGVLPAFARDFELTTDACRFTNLGMASPISRGGVGTVDVLAFRKAMLSQEMSVW